MSILIKGMEMPTSCAKCKLFGEYGCPFMGAVGYALTRGERNEYCPLIPVPPHGRLIDADALKSDDEYFIGKMMMFGGEEVYSQSTIDRAPTIIPAEEVYAEGYDTAGNYHWTGTNTGEHIIPADKESGNGL